MKSQFDVWGTTMITNFGSFGTVPSNPHPLNDIPSRPIVRETKLPLRGTAGPNVGTSIPGN
jgi:hypothetical protein